MPTKRYSTEQIVSKLRQAEEELSRGLRTPAMCKKLRDQRADLLSVADQAFDNSILKEVTSGNF